MCCVMSLLVLIGPRIATIAWYFTDNARWAAAFNNILWPILGVLFLPWTTMAYVLMSPGGVTSAGSAERVSSDTVLVTAVSPVAATLNNIGPGIGVIGATRNYSSFHWYTKLLFIWLMMLGRLELYVILVLFIPQFWRSQ